MAARVRWKGTSEALSILGWLVLIPALLLTAFLWVAQDGTLYGKIQDRYVTEESTGISDEARYALNADLAAFLRGERDRLDRVVTVFGNTRAAFWPDEQRHMNDVRDLFELARNVRWYLSLWGILLVSAALALTKKDWMACLRHGYLKALAVWGVVLLVLVAWAASDFNQAFLTFHRVVFDNQLWIMNPDTDLMIRTLPEAFFRDIALRVLAAMLATLVLALLVLLPWKNWMRALRLRNQELERREALDDD